MKVIVAVGSDKTPTIDTTGYFADAEEFLKTCMGAMHFNKIIFTNDERVVIAFQRIHELGLATVDLQHWGTGKVIELDADGDMITDWPDEFLSVIFNLRFHSGKRRKP